MKTNNRINITIKMNTITEYRYCKNVMINIVVTVPIVTKKITVTTLSVYQKVYQKAKSNRKQRQLL